MGELCRDDLRELAENINHEHAAVQGLLRAAVPHAVRAGELLAEAKGKLPHGEWLPWLAKNCAIKERTAQGYMRLARELPKLDPAKAQRVADLPLREVFKELAAHPSAIPGGAYYEAAFAFLDVCQEVLDRMKPTIEMSPEERSENGRILARIIRDADDVLKESNFRRCDALRGLGLLLKPGGIAEEGMDGRVA